MRAAVPDDYFVALPALSRRVSDRIDALVLRLEPLLIA